MQARDAVRCASNRLRESGCPSPDLDAEILVRHVLDLDRAGFWLDPERTVDDSEQNRIDALVARRADGEPVAYLTGVREFHSLIFRVDRRVLIPRPETEHVVEAVLERVRPRLGEPLSGIDVGTGSGALAVTLAFRMPRLSMIGIDRSPGALTVARSNARRLGVGHRVDFIRGDRLTAVAKERAIDVVVSNPPYITDAEMAALPEEVRLHEPDLALRSGDDPLAFHRAIARDARECLRAGGWLVLEVGASQAVSAASVREWMYGFDEVDVVHDLAGLPRVVVGRCEGL